MRPQTIRLRAGTIASSVTIPVSNLSMTFKGALVNICCVDKGTDTWTIVAPLSSKRDTVSACLFGNHIVAVGGYDGCRYLHTVEQYDPISNEWTQLSPLIIGRAGACVATVANPTS